MDSNPHDRLRTIGQPPVHGSPPTMQDGVMPMVNPFLTQKSDTLLRDPLEEGFCAAERCCLTCPKGYRIGSGSKDCSVRATTPPSSKCEERLSRSSQATSCPT